MNYPMICKDDSSQFEMSLQYLLLMSMFCSLSLSYDNGLRLVNDCPSIQSTKGSKGSLFEINIQTFQHACKMLLSRKDLEKAKMFSTRSKNLGMQLTINKERANITWNLTYKNRCHKRMFMLDVEYRVKNAEGNGAYVSYWCFRYNLSKGQPRKKENVPFYFDCIRTIPDREAYLMNIKLWSLQTNGPPSSRTRRSVISDCSGVSCTTPLTSSLEIGPIKPITNNQDDPENIKLCQCWKNSSIILKQNYHPKDVYFWIDVENLNPYAKLVTVKVYTNKDDTLPIFSQTLSLISLEEEFNPIVTPISCENEEVIYTPVLGYDCGGRVPPVNDICVVEKINGTPVQCPVKTIPPTDGRPLIYIFLFVMALIIAVMIVISCCICKARKIKQENRDRNGCLSLQSSDVIEMTCIPAENNKVENHFPGYGNPNRGIKQVMLLYHTDSTSLLREECVNLITELLTTSNIDVLGVDRVSLFRNWIELAERASKDDITDFFIIISKELVSFHKFYMTSSNGVETICTEFHDSKEYFCCAVLKALRDRYFCHGRVPFRIHILCLEHSDSRLCEQYIDAYSSFMVVENHAKNTFLYHFAKYVEATKSFILDDNVLAFLLRQLNGTETFPEYTKENMKITNIETTAMKLKLKLEELLNKSNVNV